MGRKTLYTIAGISLLGIVLFFFVRSSDDKNSSSKSSGGSLEQREQTNGVVGSQDIRPAATAGISGNIKDGDGTSLSGARVCVRASASTLTTEETHDLNCVLSTKSGGYKFADLLPAKYTITASARDFLPGGYEYDVEGENKSELPLIEGEVRTDIDISLLRGGVELKGVVKDIGGGTIAGAWVTAGEGWGFGFMSFFGNSGAAAAVTVSGENGEFSVWVAEGSADVSASAPGYADGSTSGNAPGQFIEVFLTPESVLSGRVVESSSGKPVSGAKVIARGEGFSANGSARSDNDGSFRITRLAPGRYKPEAEGKGLYGEAALSVLLGLGQTQEDILIKVFPAFTVSGTVLIKDTDEICKKSSVSLNDSGAKLNESANYDDATGQISMDAVLPGTYKVSVYCDGYISQEEYPDIEISDTDKPGLSWEVAKGATLVGRVVNSSGEPVEDANIWAKVAGGNMFSRRSGGSASTDSDGKFELKGLLEEEYSIRARAVGYIAPESETKAMPNTDEIEIVLGDGGSLTGSVVDEKGEAIGGASIRARGLSAKRSWGSANSNDDGTFVVKSMKVGKYRVTAQMGSWFGPALLGLGKGDDDLNGVEVEVRLGENSNVRLVVQSQDGVITGTVVDEEGNPVSDAFISSQRQSEAAGASRSGGRRQVRWGQWAEKPTLTDMEGRFTLRELAKGSYTILAHRKGGGEAIAEDVAVGSQTSLTIERTGSVGGSVILEDKSFPSIFSVSISDKESGFSRDEDFYRTDGEWSLSDVPAGKYKVSVRAKAGNASEDDVEVTAGKDSSGIVLTLASRATVSGTLVSLDTGDPVSGMRVSISAKTGNGFSFDSSGDKKQTTGEDGRFLVEGAPAGAVQIVAISTDFRESIYGMVQQAATVEAGQTTDIGELLVPTRKVKFRDQTGDLGFTLHERDSKTDLENREYKIALVRPKGPAATSGLKVGDIIMAVDGHDVTGVHQYLYRTLSRVSPGTTLSLTLARGATIKLTAANPR